VSPSILICPLTGLPVTTRPEWQVPLNDHFQTNICVVGNSILYSTPSGSATKEVVHDSLKLVVQAAEQVAGGTGRYVIIEDLNFLESSTLAARRKAARFTIDNPRIAAVIFCNASTQQRIGIKIGQRFTPSELQVHIAASYAEAIEQALRICDEQGLDTGPPVFLNRTRIGTEARFLSPVTAVSDQDWDVRYEGFSNRSIFIDGCILHSESHGRIKREMVPLIDEMRRKVLEQTPPEHRIDYILVDSSDITGGSARARREFLQSLAKWYQYHPFRIYVVYGASVFTRTTARLAKPFIPYNIAIARDADEAFAIVRRDRRRKSADPAARVRPDGARDTLDAHVQEVLAFIGGIDWQKEGGERMARIPEDHPAAEIFQSIAFIKEEIDDLFRERRRKREETRTLQEALGHKSKMEAIGTLSGGIAHDFNNLLGIIIGNTELALDDAARDDPSRPLLVDIFSASQRAKGVVDQLLTFSRKTSIEKRPADISQTARNAIKLLRATLPADIEIDLQVDETLALINANDNQIHQVILNLATNAADAMGDRGGRLRLSLENVVLDRTATLFDPDLRPGTFVKMTVKDTGSGIDPRDLPRIYDPYFTTKAVGKGTGIGLSVVRGIVKSHDGGIHTTSTPGRGTTLSLYFPVVADTPDPVVKTAVPAPTGNEHILYVDDEPAMVNINRKHLTRLGYTVTGMTDPIQALDWFTDHSDGVDLVITDTSMPRLTGDRLVTELLRVRPDTRIIMCTGYSDRVSESEALQLGVRKFLLKPVDTQQLAQAVRRVLDNA
jgi:signal transduction histidine kinase/ActR/RegA family two-component response regulator